ncbi:RloB family protein [Streptomyces sp. NPDC058257]|uniref:RloB family protein n=1 Tax=Streptomyces sp. NPDC058257 TaxID=3346409 RepID=UPI0036F13F96
MGRGRRGKDSWERPAQRGGQRRRQVFIFTEGKVTEPSYLDILKDHGVPHADKVPVEMHIANRKADSGRKPLDLVEQAIKLKREEDRKAKRAKLDDDFWPEVWCLFDHDNYKYIRDALEQAKTAGIGVAFSHPCFEVWRLAHYKPVSGSFGGVCDGAADRLPFQRGSQDAKNPKVVLPDQVVGSYKDARNNAERMNSQHGAHVGKWDRDPYTDVHDFVEKALHIDSY